MAKRKERLNDKELTAIIHAGVSFQHLQNMAQATYKDPGKVLQIPDKVVRAKEAQREAQEWLETPAGKAQAKVSGDQRVQEIMDWVRSTRCEKDGFWKQIVMHMLGALATAMAGLVLYFGISMFILLHQGEPASQATSKFAAKIIRLTQDTGELPRRETFPNKSHVVSDGKSEPGQ